MRTNNSELQVTPLKTEMNVGSHLIDDDDDDNDYDNDDNDYV